MLNSSVRFHFLLIATVLPVSAASQTIEMECYSDFTRSIYEGAHKFTILLDKVRLKGEMRWEWYEKNVLYDIDINEVNGPVMRGTTKFKQLVSGHWAEIPILAKQNDSFSYDSESDSMSFGSIEESFCLDSKDSVQTN